MDLGLELYFTRNLVYSRKVLRDVFGKFCSSDRKSFRAIRHSPCNTVHRIRRYSVMVPCIQHNARPFLSMCGFFCCLPGKFLPGDFLLLRARTSDFAWHQRPSKKTNGLPTGSLLNIWFHSTMPSAKKQFS